MKMKFILLMLMLLLTASGCAFTGSDGKYEEQYKPIIDEFYGIAAGNFDETDYPDYCMGMVEAANIDPDSIKGNSGYLIEDISGDRIPELLIGSADGSMIYAMFTLKDNEPQLIFDGTYRNAYTLLGDGTILNSGSAGAAYSIFGIYKLTEDGSELECQGYWFTHEKDGNFEDIRCWYNTVGEMDVSMSEELDMTLDEFWEKEEELISQKRIPKLTSFAEYVQ